MSIPFGWKYDRGETVADAVVHILGVMMAIAAAALLVVVAAHDDDVTEVVAVIVYIAGFLAMFGFSAAYNLWPISPIKWWLRRLDHSAIYLLIAGTYTPYMLVSLRDGNGWIMLGVVWALALLGILSELFLSGRVVKVVQMHIYLGMGWACSFDWAELRAALPESGFVWLAAGGILYTVGVVFYVLDIFKKLTHAHGIWHFFVLAGSVCHFVSVIAYVR